MPCIEECIFSAFVKRRGEGIEEHAGICIIGALLFPLHLITHFLLNSFEHDKDINDNLRVV